jgi:hypothetical protein
METIPSLLSLKGRMRFRYRLIDSEGTDLGPFVSKRGDWKPGERIGRSKGEDMLITAVIEPEDDVGFRAYLVVAPVASYRAVGQTD